MSSQQFLPDAPFYVLILRTAIVYGIVFVALRWAGKRQVAQMGAAELMVLLLLSESVQTSMVGPDESVVGGLIVGLTLLLLSMTLEFVAYRFRRAEPVIEGSPALLIRRGKLCEETMRREWINRSDLQQMLRKQGVQSPAEVDLAVLESDGTLSIIKSRQDEDEPSSPPDDEKPLPT